MGCTENIEKEKSGTKLSGIPAFSGLLGRGRGVKEGGTEEGGTGSCSGSSGCGELEGLSGQQSQLLERASMTIIMTNS